MIATGTDVKPIECVVFMRMVRSRNFFEQMKGRGVRTIPDRRPAGRHPRRHPQGPLRARRRRRRHRDQAHRDHPAGTQDGLVDAIDPDRQLAAAQIASGKSEPSDAEIGQTRKVMFDEAVKPLAANPSCATPW
jgi:superfamily II DNA or RNA helicase